MRGADDPHRRHARSAGRVPYGLGRTGSQVHRASAFADIRKLSSGRYQIRYPGPDGRMRTGPDTYARSGDAQRALTFIEAHMVAGEWADPNRGKVRLGGYAARWIAQRGQAAQRRAEGGQATQSIGHATGTRPEKRVLEVRKKTADHASDLHGDRKSGRPWCMARMWHGDLARMAG